MTFPLTWKVCKVLFSVGSFFFVSYWVARVSVIFDVLIGWSEAVTVVFDGIFFDWTSC
jgi:hypothetical protein